MKPKHALPSAILLLISGAAMQPLNAGTSIPGPYVNITPPPHQDLISSIIGPLNPATHIGFNSGIVNSNYRLHRALQDHLATVRTESDSVRVPMGGQVDSKGGMVATSPAAVCSSGKETVWGSLSYDWQDY